MRKFIVNKWESAARGIWEVLDSAPGYKRREVGGKGEKKRGRSKTGDRDRKAERQSKMAGGRAVGAGACPVGKSPTRGGRQDSCHREGLREAAARVLS